MGTTECVSFEATTRKRERLKEREKKKVNERNEAVHTIVIDSESYQKPNTEEAREQTIYYYYYNNHEF